VLSVLQCNVVRVAWLDGNKRVACNWKTNPSMAILRNPIGPWYPQQALAPRTVPASPALTPGSPWPSAMGPPSHRNIAMGRDGSQRIEEQTSRTSTGRYTIHSQHLACGW
jgi:hypothetical protein